MPICFLLLYSPNPEEIEEFLPFCRILLAGLVILFVVSLIEYRKRSRVRVCREGLLPGSRMIQWEDIEDVKLLSKTYVDVEVEGSPVVGYGMYSYVYGYAPSRSATYERYKIPIVQVFHKTGVEEISFKGEEFWRFVKAVIRMAENLQQTTMVCPWLMKFKKLDKMV